MPVSAAPQLQIDNLSVRYGHHLALDHVSASFPHGTVTGLIGPNGGGKSTLINAIAGTAPIAAGSINYGAQPLNRRRLRIAYVPQAREVSWDFPLNALDVVLMGITRDTGWFHRPSSAGQQRAEAALASVGMAGLGERHISQFSGGQQQRIFFARAILQEPQVVLLDEPLTGIDAPTRQRINELIREFADSGAAVLLATHDLDEVRDTSDQVLCLNRQAVAFGATDDVFTPETLRATFGGQLAVFT